MPEHRHNLITDAIFTVESSARRRSRVSLPHVMAALAAGEAIEFVALQPHQSHAWHAFLVQLGAIVARRAAEKPSRLDAAAWNGYLLALTGGTDYGWNLVVPELARPAFMQPPVPEGSLAKWKNTSRWPDDIDLLETAQNHDVKTDRIAAPAPEHWVFALVSLQTMQGYSGKNNYGIARMNGGIGNRPCFAVAQDPAWATRFARDISVLLEQQTDLVERFGYDPAEGLALMWLRSWDGAAQLSLPDLDPFFIEICRRIRLTCSGETIEARWTGSASPRIAAKDLNGVVGDLWVPIDRKEGKALTTKSLRYDKLQEVVFGDDFAPSPASLVREEDGGSPLLICQLLARDQGKTAGYHERIIPVPPKARSMLATPGGRRRLGQLSIARVATVTEVVKRVLRPALVVLLQADPPKANFSDGRAKPFIDSFDSLVDATFFANLFEDVDLDPAQARISWLKELLALAHAVLEEAKHSAPIPSARRFRAYAAADRAFGGGAYKLRSAAGEFIEEARNKGGETGEENDAGSN